MHIVGHELRFGTKMREKEKHFLLWCRDAIACEEYSLLTVDCPIHIVGHELRFGKNVREKENIFCYGAVVLSLVMTVDCRLSNAYCGT
jgi:hypothetical protein